MTLPTPRWERALNYESEPRNWLIYFEQVQQLREPVWNPYSPDGAGEWIHSAPVYRSGVAFRLAQIDDAQAQLTQLGVSTHPAPESLVVSFTAEQAVERAQRQGPAPQALHEDRSARLVVLPYGKGNTREQRLCWEIRSHTTTPVGHWVSFIDAQSGELLNVHNEVRFLEGSRMLRMTLERSTEMSLSLPCTDCGLIHLTLKTSATPMEAIC